MRAFTITKGLTAPAATNIALSQSLLAAGNLTLNGAAASGGVATLDSQRNVVITSAADDSLLTWTVIGTDEGGSAIKDQFAGANGAAATSNLNFKTVTSIYGNAATAGAVTAGTGATGSSPAKIFDDHIATPNMGFDLELVSGTGTASVQYTQEPFLTPIPPNGCSPAIALAPATPNPTWHDLQSLGQESASAQGLLNFTVHAVRLNIVTGTGVWRLTGRQAGLASP